ncbi:MAG: cation diffusion facilitator family transporter [Solobacterium sp.]|jgi:cation diffusion facilitator family transporter|nr:cation diffusion facilitator family transporter [Solobacterium sp.]
MTNWLIAHFVKDADNIKDEQVRYSYGKLSSLTGIACNILLFLLKFTIGILTNSISITSDAFNNLSDCMSCLVTLFGYKLSAKPADKEHPFGHGRMEYVVSFVVSVIIFIVAFELFKTSIEKIFTPDVVHFDLTLFIILLASILVKLWMSSFNMTIGHRIDNIAMIATAQDSKNDVIATSVTLAALLLSGFAPQIPFDGIGGVVVSCFVFYSGVGIAKDIIDKLLGSPADQQLVNAIKNQILSHPEVQGVHDMIINDYGPGMQIGSAHAEIDCHMDILKAHDVIDQAEREIDEKLHVIMTLHLDPVDYSDPETAAYREEVLRALEHIDPKLSMHDFRVVPGENHTNLVFDVLIPYDCKYNKEQIHQRIDDELSTNASKLYTVINFDHAFTAATETHE